MLWDIFCRVIDNFGDIGVCWRLCADLAARGHSVRLWVDDGTALQWMAPGALEGDWPRIQVLPWVQSGSQQTLCGLPRADAWIESFGCEIPEPFVAHYAQQLAREAAGTAPPAWLNLEYLSAESYVERSHALPSPVMRGPAQGWTKTFFYPGFTAKTGGLLREAWLPAQWQPPDTAARGAFLAQCDVPWQGECLVSLFCYEPPLLEALLEQLAAAEAPVRLLVTPGRASNAVQTLLGAQTRIGRLQISYLPALTQPEFDRLLASCDINFVRGEDSVVRAIWAGRPFVWHIYPQHDQAHAQKLEAFMECLRLGEPVRALHRAWNGLRATPDPGSDLSALHPLALPQWQSEVLAARARLFELEDLCSQLIQFARNKQ